MLRVLIVLFCFFTFSFATIAIGSSDDISPSSDTEQDQPPAVHHSELDEVVAEEEYTKEEHPVVATDEGDGEEKKEISAEKVASASASQDRIIERIDQIDQDSRRRERFLGLDFLWSVGYANHGADEVIPEHFFHGRTVSPGLFVSHPSGFRLGVEGFVSVEEEDTTDLYRTILTADMDWVLGSFYTSFQHRLVHMNREIGQSFFHNDWHRTKLQPGFRFGSLNLYALLASDVQASIPVRESSVYGGVGVGVGIPTNFLNVSANIHLSASFTRSLFWYYQYPLALSRFSAGFVTKIGGFSLNPEAALLLDPDGKSLLLLSLKLTL